MAFQVNDGTIAVLVVSCDVLGRVTDQKLILSAHDLHEYAYMQRL